MWENLEIPFQAWVIFSTILLGEKTVYNFRLKWNISKKKYEWASNCFFRRPLIFKLQQEILKLNSIYASWSSPKTALNLFKSIFCNPLFLSAIFCKPVHSFNWSEKQQLKKYGSKFEIGTMTIRFIQPLAPRPIIPLSTLCPWSPGPHVLITFITFLQIKGGYLIYFIIT